MRHLIFILLLASCGSGGGGASSDRLEQSIIPVQLVHVVGELGYQPENLQVLLDRANDIMETETGATLLYMFPKVVDSTELPIPLDISRDARRQYLDVLADYLDENGERDTDVLYLFITPPQVFDGAHWVSGFANHICAYRIRRGIAWVAATPVNATGKPRLYYSAKLIAHEVGHLLGARHYPGGIMDEAPCDLITETTPGDPSEELHFAGESISEMNRCLLDGLFG